MSCIITYKGKQYSEEQFKEYFINNKNEFTSYISKNKDVIDSFKRKMEAIDGVFKDSPELAAIGSKSQYMQYLSTIFKTSQIKDIVYHGTDSKFDVFNTTRPNGMFGTSFTTDFKTAEEYTKRNEAGKNYRVVTSILNINNPKYVDYIEASFIKEKPKNYDAYIDNTNDGLNHDEYVVFEPEQIHILSSKADIEGFKEFINNRNLNANFETNNNIPDLSEELNNTTDLNLTCFL